MWSEQEKTELLQLAHEAIESYLHCHRFQPKEPKNFALCGKAGAFVTLRQDGSLRGCIGHLSAEKPLFLVVQEMAIAAATQDPRFQPVSLSEIPDLQVEISVISPFEAIHDISKIRIGVHGLMVSRGARKGLLLPQVATEHGWNVQEFLMATCHKAGLPEDAWQKGAVIETFTAEVFSDRSGS